MKPMNKPGELKASGEINNLRMELHHAAIRRQRSNKMLRPDLMDAGKPVRLIKVKEILKQTFSINPVN